MRRKSDLLTVMRQGTASQEGGGGDSVGDALRADCVAYWKMNEASGNRIDATGRGNTLVEQNGTIASVSGLIGDAASFLGDGVYLKHDDSADLRFINSWAISMFINFNSDAYYQNIIMKGNADTGVTELQIYVGNDNGYISAYSDDTNYAVNSTPPTFSINTWYLIVIEYDDTTKTMYTSVNGDARIGGTPNPSFSSFASTDPFLVGIWANELTQPLNAKLQHVAKFSRNLTNDEYTYLYNSGAGRTLYP